MTRRKLSDGGGARRDGRFPHAFRTRQARGQAAERTGRAAETLCALSLRLRGWRIVARNWRSPAGEIDLIARRGRVIAFIEVKSRATLAAAAEGARPRQRARIRRAAEHFLATRPRLGGLQARFDAMLVTPRRWPKHIVGAWDD